MSLDESYKKEHNFLYEYQVMKLLSYQKANFELSIKRYLILFWSLESCRNQI